MREEELAGMRYMSHSVKQDLAKLDSKDVESRNVALSSLKQVVGQLDSITISRFLSQVAESRESGAARSYAISLYEDAARVHGKYVSPHIPQVMNALARSLLASGSSPQMHQTCAKVTAALSRYTIDSTTSTEDAEQIIRELSQPLANLVSGKLEPVAGGAAACLQALVETENWKRASADSVHEICQRTITALSEKSTRTVAHMHLIRSLTSMNPDILSIYGTSLLRAGVEILTLASNPWQQRMSSAKLLQDVLTILDKETLTSELPFTMQGLEGCRLDRMPHVRSAVSEALNTARLLAWADESKTSTVTAASPVLKTSERGQSLRRLGSHPISPISRHSASPVYQESRPPLPFSPVSKSTIESSHVVTQGSFPNSSPGRGARRAPLFPARDQIHQSHGSSSSPVSPSSSTTDEGDSEALALDAKENVPSRSSRVNRAGSHQYDLGLPGHGLAVRRKNWHLPPTPGVSSHSQSSSPLSRSMSESQGRIESSHLVNSGKPAGLPFADSTRNCPLPADAFLMSRSPVDVSFNSTCRVDDHTGCEQHSNSTGLRFENEVEVLLPRLRVGNTGIETLESAVQSKYIITCDEKDCKTPNPQSSQIQTFLDASIDTEKNFFHISQSSDNSNALLKNDVFGRVGDGKIATTLLNGASSKIEYREGGSPKQPVLNLQAHPYNSLSHLDSEAAPEATSALAQEPQMLLTPRDQLPLTTQRLSHSLQPDLESPDSDATISSPAPDIKSCRNDLLGETSLLKQAGLEMDVETSSDAGWSVRENPLASDESFRTGESSEEDPEGKSRGVYKAAAFPDKNIHRTSVTLHRKAWSVDGGLLCEGAQNRGSHFRNGDDIGTWRMAPKPIRSVRSFSGVGVSDELCSARGAEPKKLFLEFEAAECPAATEARAVEDEDRNAGSTSRANLSSFGTKNESTTNQHWCVCNKLVIKTPVTGESFTDDDEKRDKLRETYQEEKAEGWWAQRLGHHFVSHFIKKNWTNVRWYGEIMLAGSLCVVVALPLALIVAKTLTTSQDPPLVPT